MAARGENAVREALRRAARATFGSWSWQPPGWARWSGARAARGGAWIAAHRGPSFAALALLAVLGAGGYAGWRWYQSLPKPVGATFAVEAPARTEIENKDAKPNPLRIAFNLPVAPLASVDKPVTQGVSMSPAIAGKWAWEGDRVLVFQPKDDWPVGADYRVDFERKLFVSNVRLAKYRAEFQAAHHANCVHRQERIDLRADMMEHLSVGMGRIHP